jgi:hypothetical protein
MIKRWRPLLVGGDSLWLRARAGLRAQRPAGGLQPLCSHRRGAEPTCSCDTQQGPLPADDILDALLPVEQIPLVAAPGCRTAELVSLKLAAAGVRPAPSASWTRTATHPCRWPASSSRTCRQARTSNSSLWWRNPTCPALTARRNASRPRSSDVCRDTRGGSPPRVSHLGRRQCTPSQAEFLPHSVAGAGPGYSSSGTRRWHVVIASRDGNVPIDP